MIFAISALSLFAAPSHATEFSPALTHTLPTDGAKALVIADFNADGVADMAVALEGSGGKVSLLLGDGEGGFAERHFAPGFKPTAITAADFNRDGLLDIVLSDGKGEAIVVFLGDGKGNFRDGERRTLGSQAPSALAAADFDQDGTMDLAVAGKNPGLVWLRGKGDGAFEGPVEVGDAFQADALVAAELDRDGRVDLVVPWGVFLWQGDGGFEQKGRLDCRAPIALADFDRDGVYDLLCAHREDGRRLARYSGEGDGSFRYLGNQLLEASPNAIASGDFDQDGSSEVALTLASRNEVQLFGEFADGGWGPLGRLATGAEPNLLAAADWNQDAYTDLAAASAKGASLWLFLQSLTTVSRAGTLALNRSAKEISEGAGSLTLSVIRSDGGDGLASAEIATVDGNAVAGEDYTPVQLTLMFDSGIQSREFTVPILDDSTPEGKKTFSVQIVATTGAQKREPQTTVVTILDDDGESPAEGSSGGDSGEGAPSTPTGSNPDDSSPSDGVPAEASDGEGTIESGGGCTMITANAIDPLLPAMTFIAVAFLVHRRISRDGVGKASRQGRDSQRR